MSIKALLNENRVFSPSKIFSTQANINSNDYESKASNDRLKFWEDRAKELLWYKPWETVLEWDRPNAKWFNGGKLNASANCLDIHIKKGLGKKTALIWEGEEGDVLNFSYDDLYLKVNQFAYQLKHKFKLEKGDRVTIYMPMIPDLPIAVLACARIGAIHSVVFGGFSSQSLKDRIIDSQSKIVITANGAKRRGKFVPLKSIVDEALDNDVTCVENVLVVDYVKNQPSFMKKGRDSYYHDWIQGAKDFQEPEKMDAEDVLFILYTSGTTGKPKGIIHTTGGYMTHAKYSTKVVFDLKDSDIYWCTADVGWITGHTYFVYGPMANAATVFMYEGTPDYPDKDRFWELIAKHKISIFYTAPTAIRSFMKCGDHYPKKHDLSSLRLLGSVGEPINPEAWIWYYENIGQKKCPIVDTWWQTETGGIMITTCPGLNDMKPGCAGKPLPGIQAKVLNNDGSVSEEGGLLSLTEPWPSMLRGVWGDSDRFKEVYWTMFSTYFAGDSARIDEDGYFLVMGRVDDVLNVAGHRIGTMEIESTVDDFEGVAETAVVGMPDEIKGQAIVAFVILKENAVKTPDIENDIINFVAKKIGAIAKPKRVIISPDLPKTRSGKIMRRILKDIVAGNPIGDTTTLANPDVVDDLLTKFNS